MTFPPPPLPRPADGCALCLTYAETVIAEPYDVRLEPWGSLRCWYRCAKCRNQWQAWWSVDALGGLRVLGGAA